VVIVEQTAIIGVLAAVFLWGVVSARLQRANLTAPIVLTALGAGLAGLGLAGGQSGPEQLKPLFEITLVWVLFSDAARVRVQDLRRDVGGVLRLLGLGLPLTVLAGWGLAHWLLPALGVWLALLVGAALAPTDAALGVPVVTNTAVPSRVRRLLTVESGLNDGIATPVVMVAIAGAAAVEGAGEATLPGGALVELAIGVAVGVAVGFAGGWLLRRARRWRWAAEDISGIAVLALALLAYVVSVAVEGNGFVAAFCGGIAFGAAAGRRGPAELAFLEQTGSAVSLLVWLAFGAIAVPIVVDHLGWAVLLYSLLSLTLVRMIPVALALTGSGLDLRTVLFVGWFGPRGLASLVFALLALEELGPGADEAVAVISLTVLISVIAHGISASPLAARYGRTAAMTSSDREQ
jgi:NhaP-type Na+/H+ or K+/H+ antiporter